MLPCRPGAQPGPESSVDEDRPVQDLVEGDDAVGDEGVLEDEPLASSRASPSGKASDPEPSRMVPPITKLPGSIGSFVEVGVPTGDAPPLHAVALRRTTSDGRSEILNRMVQRERIDVTLGAISDPTRRRVLERLGEGGATISELAEPFGISLTGIRKHVRILEDAGLVATERVGRERICTLGPERLDDLEAWIADYRRMLEDRLERLVRQLKQSRR